MKPEQIFKRQYSSLSRAIRGCFTSRQNKKARTEERIKVRDRIKSFLFKLVIEGDNGVRSFAIDITWNIKKNIRLNQRVEAIFIQTLLVCNWYRA